MKILSELIRKKWIAVAFVLWMLLLFIAYGIWVLTPYISPHPFIYYSFVKSIKNGDMVIKSRNKFSFSGLKDNQGEVIVLENNKNGERYRMTYYFGDNGEFNTPFKERYESLVDSYGEFICFHDDNKSVLDFLKKK